MVLGTDGYGPIRYCFHEGLWGVMALVSHQTPRGLQPEPYNGIYYLDGYQRDEAVWNDWKTVASDTTQGKRFSI